MKTRNKALLTLVCAAALVAGSVFGTYAYLTYTTGPVTNTFTVGNVAITLDESKVNEYGKVLCADAKTIYTGEEGQTKHDPVTTNTYTLIPGATYVKDPTVHVDAQSEEAWLFVKVENGISAIEAEGNTTITEQMKTNWTLVAGQTNVYAYNTKVQAGADITVFSSFKIADNANANTENWKAGNITVTAYAVQGSFDTAAAAWAAAPLSAWTTSTQG